MSSVLAVLGKGGVGKTALTANLGYAVAELLRPRGASVIAADFDLLTGDLALHAGAGNPDDTGTIDALADPAEEVLDTALLSVSHGFSILPAANPLERTRIVPSSSVIPRVISMLAERCTVLLLDFASFGEVAALALPACTHALLVVDSTPSAAAAAERILRYCSAAGVVALGYVNSCLHGTAGVTEIPGSHRLGSLPHEVMLEKLYGRGLLCRDAPRSPYAREVRWLAELLVGRKEGDGWRNAP